MSELTHPLEPPPHRRAEQRSDTLPLIECAQPTPGSRECRFGTARSFPLRQLLR
jgi:hypothetical protein